MEAVSKNNIKAETGEHREHREHGYALAKPLSLVENGISFEQSSHSGVVLLFTQLPQRMLQVHAQHPGGTPPGSPRSGSGFVIVTTRKWRIIDRNVQETCFVVGGVVFLRIATATAPAIWIRARRVWRLEAGNDIQLAFLNHFFICTATLHGREMPQQNWAAAVEKVFDSSSLLHLATTSLLGKDASNGEMEAASEAATVQRRSPCHPTLRLSSASQASLRFFENFFSRSTFHDENFQRIYYFILSSKARPSLSYPTSTRKPTAFDDALSSILRASFSL